jgi:hypothetical protein
MHDYEECRTNLDVLARYHRDNPTDRNEATTRLQLIDRLFFECLGWSPEDVTCEEAHGGVYADYTFTAPRKILIVEAKREGRTFEVPAGMTAVEHPLPGLLRDNVELREAVRQAAEYCQDRGVLFGAVANGHQLVAFIAARHDGTPPLEGRALVFPSFEFMLEHFPELWNALSKPAIEGKRLQATLLGRTAPAIPPKLSASIPRYPGVKVRNVFQSELKVVSELVLEDITRTQEIEPRFLAECYCASGALSEYSLISRDLLRARYAALFPPDTPAPVAVPVRTREGMDPSIVADSLSRRPVLLLGDRGVGKSIFLRHLIRVDADDLLANAVTLYIDLGTEAMLTADLKAYIVDSAIEQLRIKHGCDIEERNTVRGIYNLELMRFATGIYADLQSSNPTLFAEKEIEFLEQKLGDRAEHLRHAMHHMSRGRRKQIVLFIDNADQREHETQQQAFLIAQEMAAHWPVMVFLTLRPETFHRSQREGVLSGYHPKAFTVAPPRTDLVIGKRLGFGLKIARGEIPIPMHENVGLRLKQLEAVLLALMESLRDNPALNESIENISAGNVRLALDLIQDFLGSGHVDTAKIVETFRRSGRYTVPLHEFLRAVIYGESVHYDPTRSRVANVFDVSSRDGREHFLTCIMLTALTGWSGAGVRDGFVESARVYDRLQACGYDVDQIDACLVRSLRGRLLEVPGRVIVGAESSTAFRPTAVGAYHATRLCRLFSYVDAVIVDTPILVEADRERIGLAESIMDRLARAEQFVTYLDSQWPPMASASTEFRWPDVTTDLRANLALARQNAERRGSRSR